jgi:diaminopimelate epimerase
MQWKFWKMHGASNDFVLFDDREQRFPVNDQPGIARIAARRTGIGCEGVILIQPSDKADFRMRFFNPDGSEVEMCGNGARCVSRLAHEIGAAPAVMSIDTVAGILQAEAMGDQVRLRMTDPKDWRLGEILDIKGQSYTCHFVNSGVPHAVIEVEDLEKTDVQQLGAVIRYHEQFSPAGTNANFMQLKNKDALQVRTYERGVEAETLACGTGMVACGLIAGKLGRAGSPVRIFPASGDQLEVEFELTEEGAREVKLLGPAVHVFQGAVEIP